MSLLLIALLGILVLAYLPQAWVRGVIARYSAERPDIPGTGGELARHLLDAMNLGEVKVELSKEGDHYDPEAKAVRLAPERFHGRSLAAIVIAAHEVGHAMQDATHYRPLKQRTAMAKSMRGVERLAGIIMLASPFLMLLSKSPVIFIMSYLAGALVMASTIVMHALTLPVEFDASFGRALPVLEKGGYIRPEDRPAARRILRAAAFTYVAAAAMSLLNVARWLRVIRF